MFLGFELYYFLSKENSDELNKDHITLSLYYCYYYYYYLLLLQLRAEHSEPCDIKFFQSRQKVTYHL